MHKSEMIINRHFGDVNPLLVGSEDCDPSHSYGPAVREYYLIHYVVQGKGKVFCKEREYLLGAGDLFLFSPGEVMRYQADEHQPWSYIWVGFETVLEMGEIFSRHVIHAPENGELFKELTLCRQYGETAEMYICGKIFELLARLKDKEHSEGGTVRYVLQAKNLIETRYDSDLSVSRLAAMLGLERSYFSKLFKAELGVSPQQYLVSFRLKKAAGLMREQHFTPSRAAAYSGYTDLMNFSKMFKKQFGLPPRLYYEQFK